MNRLLKWVAASLMLAPVAALGQSYQGSFTQSGAGAVNRTMLAKAREIVTFQDFGAKCDGTTDDTTAVNAAVTYATNTDFALDGLHKTCAVSGNISLTGNIWIQNVGFKQLNETSTTRTLFYRDTGTPTLINVTCDANGPTTGYDINNGACIWIDGGGDGLPSHIVQSPYLENVEVTGNGAGIGLMVSEAVNGKIINPYVHDIYYTATVDPCIEQIVGITMNADTNTQLINPYVTRLGGTITDGAPSGTCSSDGSVSPANTLRYYQTDGIDVVGGTTGLTISGGNVDRVGEGIDMSSSVLNRNIWVDDTLLSNIDSYGLKQGHMIDDSGSIGVRCVDCGLGGLVVYGGTSPPNTQGAQNIIHIGFTALDTGSNGYWSSKTTLAGISEQNGGTSSLKVQGFQCIDCSAIDRQAVPTMKDGFVNADGGSANFTVVNPTVVGATVSNFAGFAGGIYQFTGGDFNVLGRLIATQSVLTSTAAGAQTIPLSIANSSATAGTQACIDAAPSIAGIGVRSGQLCFTNDGANNISFDLNLSSGNSPASVLNINPQSNGAVTLSRDLEVRGGTPTLSSCGTGPSMATNSSDTAGLITTGSGSPTACTLTFAHAKPAAPFCVLSWDPSLTGATSYTVSTTGIAIVQGGSSAQKISYVCIRGS